MTNPTTIRVIDFETSDLPEKGGVVIEAAWAKASWEPAHPAQLYAYTPTMQRFGLPIGKTMHPAAQALHHIWPSELSLCWPFEASDAMRMICDGQTGSRVDYLVAHHASFERDMLRTYLGSEFTLPLIIDTEKCARHLWPEAENWNLQYLRYFLNLEGGLAHRQGHPAHSAYADVYITMLLLDKMITLDKTPDALSQLTSLPVHYPRCPIGKYKGEPWCNVDMGMLNWISYKAADMDEDIRHAAKTEIFFRTGR